MRRSKRLRGRRDPHDRALGRDVMVRVYNIMANLQDTLKQHAIPAVATPTVTQGRQLRQRKQGNEQDNGYR